MDKKKLLKAFKADFKAAELLRKERDGKIDQWKREYNGEKYGNEQAGKSQIVSRDIKKQDEWLHPSLLDPFVSTNDIVNVSPVTWEDEASARQSGALLNYQFCRQFDRYNFMSKSLKVLSQEGTLVVQTGWEYTDEEVEVEVPVLATLPSGEQAIVGMETVTETKVLTNKPTATVCRNEDIYIDPTCMDNMDNCQFVIHRYETDLSTLRTDGRYKNLKRVAMTMSDSANDYDFDPEDDTEFIFEDEARKKVLVYEYWGNYDVNDDGIAEPIVCAWIGDIVIRLQDNPYPDKKPPFLVVPFNSIPFQMSGESDAELLSDNQKVKTAITRGIIDNMAQSNNGQKGIRKGALDAANRKRFYKGDAFEFNGTMNDFYEGSFNQIPGSAFDMLQLQNNEIESLTAVKSFSGGLNAGSLGATATGARGALDATSTRRLNRVRNISENLVKPLMRKWLAYDNEFLDDTEVIRVTNEEYIEINKDDLAGRVDLEINVSTAEDNNAKAQEISFMVQTLGQSMSEEMRYGMLAQWADLTKQPKLAKQFRDWTPPEPDPMQQQMAQLQLQKAQLENAKLQAEIEDRYARAQENQIDSRLKTAKAVNEEAKARLTGSQADKADLEFLKEDEDIAHYQKMELEEHKRKSDLDKMAFQAMYGGKNEQIGVPGN